ncbi:hypothetical protein F4813DRAFT_368826 [Daldinia decipiens]|uniref:uncharacterized protein n=1 Tax=Daldinia decipiens TaxID=326647 RepID=UPI0020C372A2|nr:uncharacterized protein F4813DRAFT_368826 [Daldinia decipiens]KAI1654896.1 hypothetical protein F4813DRAFT_368826 [Daldinia decipiens]
MYVCMYVCIVVIRTHTLPIPYTAIPFANIWLFPYPTHAPHPPSNTRRWRLSAHHLLGGQRPPRAHGGGGGLREKGIPTYLYRLYIYLPIYMHVPDLASARFLSDKLDMDTGGNKDLGNLHVVLRTCRASSTYVYVCMYPHAASRSLADRSSFSSRAGRWEGHVRMDTYFSSSSPRQEKARQV